MKSYNKEITVGLDVCWYQVEILPRITILFGSQKMLAIEWLFFSLWVQLDN